MCRICAWCLHAGYIFYSNLFYSLFHFTCTRTNGLTFPQATILLATSEREREENGPTVFIYERQDGKSVYVSVCLCVTHTHTHTRAYMTCRNLNTMRHNTHTSCCSRSYTLWPQASCSPAARKLYTTIALRRHIYRLPNALYPASGLTPTRKLRSGRRLV